jgi:hypothetical protein
MTPHVPAIPTAAELAHRAAERAVPHAEPAPVLAGAAQPARRAWLLSLAAAIVAP